MGMWSILHVTDYACFQASLLERLPTDNKVLILYSDAEAVKSRCAQAPFGKGERTVVDKTVRDTWEIDASKVRTASVLWQL